MIIAPQQILLDQFHGLNLRDRSSKVPLEDASFLQNVWISDASGAIETRPGMINDPRVDHDFTVKITGLHRFYRAAAKQSLAYAFSSGDGADRLFFIDSGAWTDTGIGFTASNRIPVIITLNLPTNKVYIANGADLLSEWDGTVGASITVDGDFHPDAVSQVAGFMLAIGREQPGRVYYTSSAGDLTAWSQLPFYTSDATWPTAITGWEGRPLVWTHNSMYSIEGFPNNIRVSEINTGFGCLAHRTLVKVGTEIMWAGRGPEGFGVFRWAGGKPVEVSKKIYPILASIDLANANKAWAMAYEKYYLLFFPATADGTGEPSRCLAYHMRTGRWYDWRDMNFSSGVYENADTDLNVLRLGANAAGTDAAFRIHKLTLGAYANPFDTNGIDSIWDTTDFDGGDITVPKQWLYYQPRFKVLGSGSFNLGNVTGIIDNVAGAALSIDVNDPNDQILAIQDISGNKFPSGHFLRTRIRTRGTKGIRYDTLKIGFEAKRVQNVAG